MFLGLPEVSLQFPVEFPIQERYRDPEDDLQLEGRLQAGQALSLLIVGDVRCGFVPQQGGHVFLRESHLFAVNPETILRRGTCLAVNVRGNFCFAHVLRIGNFQPPGKEGEVAS